MFFYFLAAIVEPLSTAYTELELYDPSFKIKFQRHQSQAFFFDLPLEFFYFLLVNEKLPLSFRFMVVPVAEIVRRDFIDLTSVPLNPIPHSSVSRTLYSCRALRFTASAFGPVGFIGQPSASTTLKPR
jgi:hypothetical protein